MDARIIELIGRPRPRLAYVPSAAHPEQLYYRQKRDYYARLGAELAFYIEPDQELSHATRRALLGCDGVHLSGGNTYLFLEWLRRRGLLSVLRAYASDGGVLVGESAGAILMTPDVRSAALCEDVAPPGTVDVQALGLASFHFWPHYGEESGCGSMSEILEQFPLVYACANGSGVVVDGERIEMFGTVAVFRRGVGGEV